MAQHDMNIANQGFPATRADLNNALQALVSNSSGTSAPSTTFANQWWYDTTNNKMYLRNEANNAWIEVFTLDQTNNEWQLTTGVIQAKDSDGLALKTDDGTTRLFIVDSDGDVGVGTTSPRAKTEVYDSSVSAVFDAGNLSTWRVMQVRNNIESNTGTAAGIALGGDGSGDTETAGIVGISDNSSGGVCQLAFITATGNNSIERARILAHGTFTIGSGTEDAGYGPLHIGSTSTASTVMQMLSSSTGYNTIHFGDATSGAGRYVGYVQYNHNDDSLNLNGSQTVRMAIAGTTRMLLDDNEFYPSPDNYVTLGWSGGRFVQIFAVSGSINTSDRNEKQDIEDLSEAEKRVAVAAKGLIKKYRWIDAVQKKGDDARIHVGIIAQDLKSAFEAEGLDAHRYGMFCSDTWWTKDRVVPAVEAVEAQDAVYNEEGDLVSEAVEAVEAQDEHTVTDTFRTSDEAPDGATEHTRLGVRYDELFAFIIGSM